MSVLILDAEIISQKDMLIRLRWELGISLGCRKSESENRSVMSNSLQHNGLYSPWNSPGQNTGVGSLSLLQGIFPTQGLNSGLLHYRQILYQLSYEGSPNWSGLPCPSPGNVSNPGIEPRSSALQADSLPCEPAGKPYTCGR